MHNKPPSAKEEPGSAEADWELSIESTISQKARVLKQADPDVTSNPYERNEQPVSKDARNTRTKLDELRRLSESIKAKREPEGK